MAIKARRGRREGRWRRRYRALHEWLSRLPCASTIAFVMCVGGILIFTGCLYAALEYLVTRFDLEIIGDILWLVMVGHVAMATFFLAVAVLSTGATRREVCTRCVSVNIIGRCCHCVVIVLAYIFHIVWMFLPAVLLIPVGLLIVFTILCQIIPNCITLSDYGVPPDIVDTINPDQIIAQLKNITKEDINTYIAQAEVFVSNVIDAAEDSPELEKILSTVENIVPPDEEIQKFVDKITSHVNSDQMVEVIERMQDGVDQATEKLLNLIEQGGDHLDNLNLNVGDVVGEHIDKIDVDIDKSLGKHIDNIADKADREMSKLENQTNTGESYLLPDLSKKGEIQLQNINATIGEGNPINRLPTGKNLESITNSSTHITPMNTTRIRKRDVGDVGAVGNKSRDAGKKVQKKVDEAKSTIDDAKKQTESSAENAKKAAADLQHNIKAETEKAKSTIEDAKKQTESSVENAKKAVDDLQHNIKAETEKAKEKVHKSAEDAKEKVEHITDQAKETAEEIKENVGALKEDVEEQAREVVDKAKAEIENAKERAEEEVKQLETETKEKIEHLTEEGQKLAEDVRKKAETLKDDIQDKTRQELENLKNTGEKTVQELQNTGKKLVEDGRKHIENLGKNAKALSEEAQVAARETAKQVVSEARRLVKDAQIAAKVAAKEAEKAMERAKEAAKALANEVDVKVKELARTAEAKARHAAEVASQVAKGALETAKKVAENADDLIRGIATGATDLIRKASRNIRYYAKEAIKGARIAVREAAKGAREAAKIFEIAKKEVVKGYEILMEVADQLGIERKNKTDTYCSEAKKFYCMEIKKAQINMIFVFIASIIINLSMVHFLMAMSANYVHVKRELIEENRRTQRELESMNQPESKLAILDLQMNDTGSYCTDV